MAAWLMAWTVWVVGTVAPPAMAPEPAACVRPRTAQDVARRAVATGLLASRTWVETRLQGSRTGKQLTLNRQRAADLLDRARSTGAWNVMGQQEQTQMLLPAGAWTQTQVQRGSWLLEGSGALLWAVKVHQDLPGYEAPLGAERILKAINPKGAAENVLRRPVVRESSALGGALQEAQFFAWRADMEQQRRRQQVSNVEPVVLKLLRNGWTTHHNGVDLMAGDAAMTALTDQQVSWVREAARAREQALRFACGI